MDKKDLHECQDSVNSGDSIQGRNCVICVPEYYCFNFCGEGGSVSSCISWQHFPRSTSSRSNCDEYSEESEKSLSKSVTETTKEDEKETTVPSSLMYPRSRSVAELRILHYFEIRHIYEFLNFLLSHLVCNEPDDPVEFLEDLLDKCINFRDRGEEPPLLFSDAHIKSLYNAFDPFERGYLTVEQYHEAIKALGLLSMPYNKEPPLNDEGFVTQSDFIFEATNNLVENLRRMLRIPENWEENVHTWKKVLAKRKSRLSKKAEEIEFKAEYSGEQEFNEYPKRYSVFEKKPLTYRPATQKNPMQLFLD